jgi:acyl-CoA thioester hydrolase
MQLKIKHEVKIRVRYGETDQMGYCYYGNYAQYFEVGRVETMRKIGLTYKALEASGKMLPVYHFSIDYYLPAHYDDELTILTEIIMLKGPQLFFEYQVFNEQKDLLCKAKTTLVFIQSSTKKPTVPPADFINLLKPYEQ